MSDKRLSPESGQEFAVHGASAHTARRIARSVTRAYTKPLARLYVYLRFRIISPRMLAALMREIPGEGTLVTVGCGFGLFDLAFGLANPEKRILGCDLSPARIESACAARDVLGLSNNHFEVRDLCIPGGIPPCRQILALDILHHLPRDAQDRLIASAMDALEPGGRLVIKDIHRDAPLKLAFTWLLDKIMTGGDRMFYFSEDDLGKRLRDAGFQTVMARMNSLLPFPHVLVLAHKPGDCLQPPDRSAQHT